MTERIDLKELGTGEEGEKAIPRRLWLAVVAAVVLATGLMLRWLEVGGIAEHVLAGIALTIVAIPVAYEALKQFRSNPFNTEMLMITAAVGASAISVFEEGAAVLILYNFAEAVEDYTVDKVRRVARKMAALLPQRAMVKRNNELVEVPVEDLKVGDVIVVKPGWRIPIDGRIIAGYTNVDQAAVTGESMPVEKGPGAEVLSGTLNLDRSIEVRVEKPFKDSTISRVINLVVEARERKAKVERFIDRFSRFYAPSTITLAVLIVLVPLLILGQPWEVWVYRALVVLVIACPSALVISTPVTMLMGLTRAMWSSVLVKGGIYLEEVAKIKVVAFDKTGTLTKGRLKVTKITAAEGFRDGDVLRFAALAEARSGHPIATAILEAAKASGLDLNGDAQLVDVPGKGVKANLEGKVILIGKTSFLVEERIELGKMSIQANGDSVGTQVAVAVDGRLAGSIILLDEIRPEAKEAITLLKSQGVKVFMLTGDNDTTARQIAQDLGIEEYYAELLPEDKVRIAKELRQRYGAVMMVGDGVNDAPVLAASNVGVAVGTAGNDVAIDVADVALMGSDLRMIPYLLRLGRRVISTLKMNIGIALGLKFLLIILGASGFIPLWIGVLGDDGVTLIVIAYTLPLLRFKS
ncbi:cadmium-translocating P-type ATPase [Candidatus Bathyarchaeota archaeon]|nr:cadmium-translocating P-type ATPase [Candidatus Bathyarchaeota archaeon]